ncbi:MAG: hypothetical protein UR60_C0021G0014 [Candidatus Moranbacteria bacterium GW2011_GWF2_34_56]|nr:MAG: hypothetical protein UR51_C0008G0019 [Candidatus Moranbacteria bacterium GW2011_GWF1_34_10]KKP64446.1 MAG: hypothetical protein UR60_C0021G0014 [Candidatus Moranbacteria bacterium GW2011_GWF2_34_56]HBI17094.1 hypothetical protein [Candidatus Moranbacteria bacterium]
MTKKFLLVYIGFAFILNFIWEVSQAGLYTPHFEGISGLFCVHLKATLGDVIILLVIYIIMSLILRDLKWINQKNKTLLISSAILGFVFAVTIEKYALLNNRWAYNELMPLIPYLDVGLSPIMQLLIIVPATIYFTRIYGLK